MNEGWQERLDNLASIEGDVDLVVQREDNEAVYFLHFTNIKRTKGELQSGTYKAVIIMLREPEQKERDVNVL